MKKVVVFFFYFLFLFFLTLKWHICGQILLLLLIWFISSTFMGKSKPGLASGHMMLKTRQFQLYHASHFCMNVVCRADFFFPANFCHPPLLLASYSPFLFLLKTNSSLSVLALAPALAHFMTDEGDVASTFFRSKSPCSVWFLFLSLWKTKSTYKHLQRKTKPSLPSPHH